MMSKTCPRHVPIGGFAHAVGGVRESGSECWHVGSRLRGRSKRLHRPHAHALVLRSCESCEPRHAPASHTRFALGAGSMRAACRTCCRPAGAPCSRAGGSEVASATRGSASSSRHRRFVASAAICARCVTAVASPPLGLPGLLPRRAGLGGRAAGRRRGARLLVGRGDADSCSPRLHRAFRRCAPCSRRRRRTAAAASGGRAAALLAGGGAIGCRAVGCRAVGSERCWQLTVCGRACRRAARTAQQPQHEPPSDEGGLAWRRPAWEEAARRARRRGLVRQ